MNHPPQLFEITYEVSLSPKINRKLYHEKIIIACIPITIFISSSCNKKPNKLIDVKNKPNIIQENINGLKAISQSDSLEYFAEQKDEHLQSIHSDNLFAELRKEAGYISHQRLGFQATEDYFINPEESYRKANN